MRVLHLNQALDDERREIEFWKGRSPELEEEFLDELSKAIDTIAKSPEGYARASKRTQLRRFVEKRFQTAILYRFFKEEDLLMIARVYNCRMDPKRFLP
jgi:plasmid stabilization system protein ParE